MIDAMLKNDLKEPIFSEDGEFFKVTFTGKDFISKHVELNNRLASLLESDKNEITISEYIKLFSVSRNTASVDLNYLVENNLARKIKKSKTYVFEIL